MHGAGLVVALQALLARQTAQPTALCTAPSCLPAAVLCAPSLVARVLRASASPPPSPPRHGEVPEALVKWSLRDGSHPRPPMAMPADLEKAMVAHAFTTYDRKVGALLPPVGQATA